MAARDALGRPNFFGGNTVRPTTYAKGPNGQISVGGVRMQDLAAKYGTPLYVLDYETLVRQMTAYRVALSQMDPPGHAHYAGKAFLCQAMASLVQEQGLGLDVVSGGELATALKAGVDPAHILFHGNVKSRQEIQMALEQGVGRLVVDSLDELRRINAMAGDRGLKASILLRITPGIDAHTHDFIRTGHFDSKFGFGLSEGIADHAVEEALGSDHLRLEGFHAHIGSQILESAPFIANAEALLGFSRAWYDKAGFWPSVLDLGGGIGVKYGPHDVPPSLHPMVRQVDALVRQMTPPGQSRPQIILEPGRSIVAEAGLTIYSVEAVKTVAGGHTYVAVDGGMGDNIRPALYQASYGAELDAKPEFLPMKPVTIAGRYCESGDILIHEALLAEPLTGDRLVVWGTGAYNYAMASTYNRVPRPAVVAVRDGQSAVWVERESYEDLMRLDRSLDSGIN